ncbi:MAG: cyd operon YbgE family protein [Alphaproteobacteria bacterium]|nr:cyd operon YbgE family protein [Alphaproteobacteria bacterium]
MLPLLTACVIVAAVTAYPPAFTDAQGKVDHGFLTILMWSVTAGLVRGVGFIPRNKILRMCFSAPACYAALALAAALKFYR